MLLLLFFGILVLSALVIHLLLGSGVSAKQTARALEVNLLSLGSRLRNRMLWPSQTKIPSRTRRLKLGRMPAALRLRR